MLQKLHDNIKGWVASVVIGLICLAFVFWGVQSYVSHETAKGKTLATVGGKEITDQDVHRLSQQMQRQLSAQNRAITSQMREQLKFMALQQLVGQAALVQAANKSGFYVDDSQVKQVISSLPQFKSQGVFSPQLFAQFIYASGLTQSQFVNEVKVQILIAQVANALQFSSFVLPNELKTYYDLIKQTRNFSYVTIPLEKFSKTVSITPSEEQDYYKNNQDRFSLPEQVSVAYLKLSPQQVGEGVKISDATLQQYYQDNLGNYRTPWTWNIDRITVKLPANASSKQVSDTRSKMQAILTKLEKGEAFSKLMQQEAGVNETIKETGASAQLLSTLRRLKPQQVSRPFYTPQGYTVVRLVKVTKAQVKPFSSVKDNIKVALVNQKVQKKLQAMSEQLTNLTYTNPDSLAEAARELKLQIQYSPLFGRLGTKTGISASPAVVQAAFSEDVLQDGNNSNLITLKDGSVIVLRVKQHVASKVKSFAEVKDAIHAELVAKTEQAQAAILAQQIQGRLQKGESLQQVAQAQKLSWVNKEDIARTNKQVLPVVLKAAFNLSLQRGMNSTVVELPGGDTAVLVLSAVNSPDFSKVSDKEKQELQARLQQFVGGLTYQLYSTGVKNNTAIKYSKK